MADRSLVGRVVDVEDPLTWPESLRELFADSRELLSRFEERQRQIDNFPGARFTQTNEFANERRAVLGKGEQILATERILGFHCTRLLAREAQNIRVEGLKLPSPDFLLERIESAVNEGYVPREIAERLVAENKAADPARQSRIGFANARSNLKEVHLVCRFFQYWGGEALYYSHEGDPITGPILMSIGQAYVVVAALPTKSMQVPGRLPEYFINAFLQGIGVRTRNGSAFESSVSEDVPPDWLLQIVGSADPGFTILTGLGAA